MNRSNIEKDVIELITSFVGAKDINLDTSLIGKGGIMDSMTAVQLINSLEEKFKIFFMHDDLNLEAFSSVRSLVGLIEKYSE
jgi:acyl carrier protein